MEKAIDILLNVCFLCSVLSDSIFSGESGECEQKKKSEGYERKLTIT